MTDQLKKDIIQWDIKSWSKALDYWESSIDWSTVTNGLELGGQLGGLSLWLASKGIQTVCSDLNDVRTKAMPLHEKYGVTEMIEYRDIDATDIPYENHFDVIVFKSIIGGIGRNGNHAIQQKVFSEIHKALKPGGKLLFAENLMASSLHRRLRKKFVKWGDAWRYLSVREMHDFLKAFDAYDMKTTGVLATFGRSEGQRNFLASADQLLLNGISPDNWKYISYGIAVK